jgi:dihydrofolate reductase
MGRVRYGINITLDGCCDHEAGIPDEEMHMYWAEAVARSSALLYGRITYQMMEQGWRAISETGVAPEGMPDWMVPFAHSIGKARKYVVSGTLTKVDWNTELVQGDLRQAVERLKQQESGLISTGGVQLPGELAKLGLIDEYEFVVHPRIAGRGPTLLTGLPAFVDLRLVERREFKSGALALLYEVKR